MIKAEIFRNKRNGIYGFCISGHAGYAESGADIVCSAVTVLTFNTINCIEMFTDLEFDCEIDDKKGGYLFYSIPVLKKDGENHDAQLLLKAMVNGLKNIKDEYECYINIYDEEVQ